MKSKNEALCFVGLTKLLTVLRGPLIATVTYFVGPTFNFTLKLMPYVGLLPVQPFAKSNQSTKLPIQNPKFIVPQV